MIQWCMARVRTALRYKDLLFLLVQRDIKLKYRRSFMGYLWSVLNPLFVMIVMAVVFSSFFRQDIENFPVYLFTGQLIFSYTTGAGTKALELILDNAPLIKKVYIPKYIFVMARVISTLVDTVFSLAARRSVWKRSLNEPLFSCNCHSSCSINVVTIFLTCFLYR